MSPVLPLHGCIHLRWLALGLLALLHACVLASPIAPSPSPTFESRTPSAPPSPIRKAATDTPPRPSPSPTVCQPTTGQVQAYAIEPTPIGKPLRFRLYLPPCYNPSATDGYPVLILLHGQGSDETLWLELGLPQILDGLVQSRTINPFLVIMPYEEYNLKGPDESHYAEALLQGLIPWVEINLPVCTQRSCRAVGGISRGGAWALRLGLSEPQRFIAVGGHSPVPFWDEAMRLRQRTDKINPEDWPRIYLDIGRKDRFLSYATDFVNTLEALGLPYEWHLNDGEHDTTYWQANLQTYLLWYAAQFFRPQESPQK